MRVPDTVRQCVAFVGLPSLQADGTYGLRWGGTAFFVSVPSESIPKGQYLYIVTAKHVAERLQQKEFNIRMNTRDGRSALLIGQDVKWWHHPTDDSVDVAVLPCTLPANAEYKTIPTSMFLTEEIARSHNIGAGDEVHIVGLFAKLAGATRNIPIVRGGNIAMMPGEPVPTRIGSIEAYLVEARSIGGLSGSPVFVRQSVSLGAGEVYLLGLMHGHWDIPADGINVVDASGELGSVNMGIAIVVPAKKILEVLYRREFIEGRRQRDEEARRERAPMLDEAVGQADSGQADGEDQ